MAPVFDRLPMFGGTIPVLPGSRLLGVPTPLPGGLLVTWLPAAFVPGAVLDRPGMAVVFCPVPTGPGWPPAPTFVRAPTRLPAAVLVLLVAPPVVVRLPGPWFVVLAAPGPVCTPAPVRVPAVAAPVPVRAAPSTRTLEAVAVRLLVIF